MKILAILVIATVFPVFLWAQTIGKTSIDTTENFSSLGEVTDTVPNVDIFESDDLLKVTLK